MHFLGIDWVGVNAENGRKLVLSLAFIAFIVGGGVGLRALVGLVLTRTDHSTLQTKFWTRQGISLLAAILLVLGLLSIWFNDPTRLATAFGLYLGGPRLRPAAGGDLARGLFRDPTRIDVHGG